MDNKTAINFSVGVIIITLAALVIYVIVSQPKKPKAPVVLGNGKLSSDTQATLKTITASQAAGTAPLTTEQITAVSELTAAAAAATGQTAAERLATLKSGNSPGGFFEGLKAVFSGDINPLDLWGQMGNAELNAANIPLPVSAPDTPGGEDTAMSTYTPGGADDPYLQVLAGQNTNVLNTSLASKYGVQIPQQ